MKNLPARLSLFPHFLYLLPFFFVFHGTALAPSTVTLTDFFTLFGQYLFFSLLLFLAGVLLYRAKEKAALFSFLCLFIHLFFGALHDGLKSISPTLFLAKYTVLLPMLGLIVVAFSIYLKRRRNSFQQLIRYLNLLLVVLVLLDIPSLLREEKPVPPSVRLQPCVGCEKPDIYLLVADEYADSTSLSDLFAFNNGSFLAQLRKRGFMIPKSVSNYNFTPFAMASLFSMDYLKDIEGRNSSYADRLTCANAINKNPLWDFLVQSGYTIKNNSIYRINNIPTVAPQTHFRIGTDFIDSHTLWSRLKRDLGYHLVTSLKLRFMEDQYTFYMDKTNKRLLQRLSGDLTKKSTGQQFVYTHIHMPHYPYYYRKDGSRNPAAGDPANAFDKNDYVGYLQYSNQVYLRVIDEILQHSSTPPVIIFMGDHGFREFENPNAAEKKAYFMNLNAVYLPNGKGRHFYEGISGVNQFRALLNSVFQQQLPMLNDSTSFLQE